MSCANPIEKQNLYRTIIIVNIVHHYQAGKQRDEEQLYKSLVSCLSKHCYQVYKVRDDSN